jgi:hypothetical protein
MLVKGTAVPTATLLPKTEDQENNHLKDEGTIESILRGSKPNAEGRFANRNRRPAGLTVFREASEGLYGKTHDCRAGRSRSLVITLSRLVMTDSQWRPFTSMLALCTSARLPQPQSALYGTQLEASSVYLNQIFSNSFSRISNFGAIVQPYFCNVYNITGPRLALRYL